jgi:hypothetical protein
MLINVTFPPYDPHWNPLPISKELSLDQSAFKRIIALAATPL